MCTQMHQENSQRKNLSYNHDVTEWYRHNYADFLLSPLEV